MAASSRNRQGSDTRKQLIKIAERLFAEQGIEGVSIRAINAAAKQGAASTHYHFGSKDKIVEAVVLDLGIPVTDAIEERVHVLAAREQPPTATELVELIAIPYLHLLQTQRVRGRRWVKVIAQLALANDPLLAQMTVGVSAHITEQVRRAFPDVDEERLQMRWDVASRTLIQMLSQVDQWAGHPGSDPDALDRFVRELVEFVAGGLDALRAERSSSPPEAAPSASRRRARAA